MTKRVPPRNVLIVGAGGFGRETASLLRTLQVDGEFGAAGFADDSRALEDRSVMGLPIVGRVEIAKELTELNVVVTVGNPNRYDTKRRIVERLELDPGRYVTLIHPSTSIGSEVTVGNGTVILAGCVVTQGVKIGAHVGVMPTVVLTHDNIVGDFAILGAGAKLGGGVRIGEGAYIGSGALVRESIVVGAGAMIGMGAVVVNDVPAGETWVGVPARPLSRPTRRFTAS